jgi:rubrerythrin
MAETSADVEHLLEVCRRIEFTLASLYRFLSNLYGDIPDIAAVFLKTANEEENHALQFVHALKLPNVIEHPTAAAGSEDYLLRDVLDLDAKVRRTPPPPVDALRTAVDLERRLAGYHMDTIGVFRQPRLQEMFKAMMAADKDHVETLTAALAKLSPPSDGRVGSKVRG